MYVGQEGGEKPQPQIPFQFALACPFNPGRDDGCHQVEPDEHIDIPQVSHLAPEVDGNVQNVNAHFGDGLAAGQHKIAGIDDAPCDKGIDDAGEPLAEKGGDTPLHGEQQKSRQHDEEGNRCAAQRGDDTYPESVVAGDDTELVANVVELAGVLLHYQIAGDNSQ